MRIFRKSGQPDQEQSPATEAVPAKRHWEMLFVSTLVVAGALLLDVRPDQRVFIHGFPDYPLPPSCLSREFFQTPCPGCGLTRSIVHLAQGEWRQSLDKHRLGWFMALAVLLQFPYRLSALCLPHRIALSPRTRKWIGNIIVALIVGNWLLEVLVS